MTDQKRSTWTFLSNHAHVLVCLARNPDALVRDVADQVGITERAALNILKELELAGVISRRREGRRNHYDIHPEVALRHPLESDRNVGSLLTMVLGVSEAKRIGLTPSSAPAAGRSQRRTGKVRSAR